MDRKEQVLELLMTSDTPLAGTELAAKFGVTRQVIVKDIAILRAQGYTIFSTPKGYVAQKATSFSVTRRVRVSHGVDKIRDELETVVDLGGKVLNTYIDHAAYGSFGEVLNVKSRRDIDAFIEKIESAGCEPLLSLTKGVHIHTIEAESEEALDIIVSALDKKGYLIK